MTTQRTFSIQTPETLRPLSDKWRKNVDKQKDNQGFPLDEGLCCVLCGKKATNAGIFVFLSDSSKYVTDTEVNTAHDLGVFPVGSDCAKKLVKAGIPIYTKAQTVAVYNAK